MAIDRDALVALQGGVGSPSGGLWPEGHVLYDAELENGYAFDPERARKLLAEAGYPDGFSLTSFYLAGDAQRMAELVRRKWAEIGVTLEFVASTDYFTDFFLNAEADLFAAPQAGLGTVIESPDPSSSGLCAQSVISRQSQQGLPTSPREP
jgi:ABC-type transport system substrate-binding protein